MVVAQSDETTERLQAMKMAESTVLKPVCVTERVTGSKNIEDLTQFFALSLLE